MYLLEYEEDGNTVKAAAVYPHRPEIWDIAPAPHDPALLFTVYNDASGARLHVCFVIIIYWHRFLRCIYTDLLKPQAADTARRCGVC